MSWSGQFQVDLQIFQVNLWSTLGGTKSSRNLTWVDFGPGCKVNLVDFWSWWRTNSKLTWLIWYAQSNKPTMFALKFLSEWTCSQWIMKLGKSKWRIFLANHSPRLGHRYYYVLLRWIFGVINTHFLTG